MLELKNQNDVPKIRSAWVEYISYTNDTNRTLTSATTAGILSFKFTIKFLSEIINFIFSLRFKME